MSDKVITKRSGKFTLIDNALINDSRISFKAKGIMAYMLSKPDSWNYNIKGDFCKRSKDGQSAIYSGIKELIAAGYISRTKNSDGFITYHVFENHLDNDVRDYASTQLIDSKPDRENPDQENPDQENRDVLIRLNSTNTKISNTEGSKSVKEFDATTALRQLNVSDFVIGEFIAHRKRIKKAISQLVINGFIREAKKAGITVEHAITISVERGWTGFNANWNWNGDGGKKLARDISNTSYQDNKDSKVKKLGFMNGVDQSDIDGELE